MQKIQTYCLIALLSLLCGFWLSYHYCNDAKRYFMIETEKRVVVLKVDKKGGIKIDYEQ